MVLNKITRGYAKFISNNPLKIIALALVFTILCVGFYSQIYVDNPNINELLPENIPVVDALFKVQDDFGGGTTSAFMVAVELNQSTGTPNTILDPQIVRYTNTIGKQIETLEGVERVESMGSSMQDLNGGHKVASLVETKQLYEDHRSLFSRTINDKFTISVLRIYATPDWDVEYMVDEVDKIIANTPRPAGLTVYPTGESIAQQVSQELVGPDSQKTTMISFVAIVVLLLLTFRSFVYGLLPLTTIIFGVMWTFGFIGASGIAMSNFSSGAISMIIGIGIDFGIQIIMRFKQELEYSKPVLAMQNTLSNVFIPMLTTTIAAFIGFQAMTLGQFAVIGELGKIMSIGVVYCFLAAVTIVPAVLVLYEKRRMKKND